MINADKESIELCGARCTVIESPRSFTRTLGGFADYLADGMSHSAEYHDKAYVCIHVFDSSRPVLLVSRADGDWCYLCGDAHEDIAENYRVVGKGHILDRDPTLRQLSDLGANWEAERTFVGDPWVRRLIPQVE